MRECVSGEWKRAKEEAEERGRLASAPWQRVPIALKFFPQSASRCSSARVLRGCQSARGLKRKVTRTMKRYVARENELAEL